MSSTKDWENWLEEIAAGELQDRIYLDNNATTPLSPEVRRLMDLAAAGPPSNASSQHRHGQLAARTLGRVRETVLTLLGANLSDFPADELILTSGGTEANNLAVLGFAPLEGGNVVLSGIEHPSVAALVPQLEQQGVETRIAHADTNGVVSAKQVAELLDDQTGLVSVMLANNETGVIQPIREIADCCRSRDIICHTDAVQAIGKIDVSFSSLGVDALSFAPHKFHGPKGVGGLLVRAGRQPRPLFHGGFQQQGFRPGTEDLVTGCGMAAALAWYLDHVPEFRARVTDLRNEFESTLLAETPDIVVHGRDSERLGTTSCISIPGIDRQRFVMAADVAGVSCATGSACASGSSDPSPTLLSMGLEASLIESAVRFSFGVFNRPGDARESARRISLIIKNLRR